MKTLVMPHQIKGELSSASGEDGLVVGQSCGPLGAQISAMLVHQKKTLFAFLTPAHRQGSSSSRPSDLREQEAPSHVESLGATPVDVSKSGVLPQTIRETSESPSGF